MNSDTRAYEHATRSRDYPDEFSICYVDESHMKAFEEALHADEFAVTDLNDAPSPGPSYSGTHTPLGHRVRKVSALSDFAPVNQRVKRRRKQSNSRRQEKRQEWLFVLVRWPLLSLILLFIAAEFGLYVLIRQLVNTKEWLISWRGRKGIFRRRLRSSRTYQEWKDAALALDEYLHFDEWKTVDEDPYYDWKLVRKVLRTLRNLRMENDVRGVLGVLETCIRTNFAGVESSRLYSETFYGTKDLLEEYVTEQERALEFIRESPNISVEEKKRFFKNTNTNLGSTALCLSGGATFGYYHFGVVKAFLDANILPRVISGTSAGGLVAALVCTRTDEELKRLLVPELANRITACEEPFSVWFKRFLMTGARFDSVSWARKSAFFTRGSMTFREAYLRTGRILNVSVIPADRHSPTKLLNYLTAPDTVIWSALLASAAVPGILNPVVLMQKQKDGTLVPWNWGSKFKDGSLRVDIPVQSLNLYFNVTHPVVSQVNPHVHLFFFAPRGSAGKPVATRKGKGWRGNFLLSAAEQWLKLELTKNFKVIRDLDLLPQLLGQDWSSLFLQRFDGSVTIWPRTRPWDWVRILTDPDPPELERMMRVGQLVTWPKLHIIENRYRLEKQILLGRQAVRKAIRSRTREPLAVKSESEPQGPLPPPITGTKLPNVPLSANSIRTESPLPIDSDAEVAYDNQPSRSPHYRHHSHRRSPLVSPPGFTSGDPRRSPYIRRRWTSSLLANGESGDDIPEADYGMATPDPPPEPESESEPEKQEPDHPSAQTTRSSSPPVPTSPSVFQRFRTASATYSPFASLRRNSRLLSKEPSRLNLNEHGELKWAEESSSDDDDLSVASGRVWKQVDSLSEGEGEDESRVAMES